MTEQSINYIDELNAYFRAKDALRRNVGEAEVAVQSANIRLWEILLDNPDHGVELGKCGHSNNCPVCLQLVYIQAKEGILGNARRALIAHRSTLPIKK